MDDNAARGTEFMLEKKIHRICPFSVFWSSLFTDTGSTFAAPVDGDKKLCSSVGAVILPMLRQRALSDVVLQPSTVIQVTGCPENCEGG